MRVTHLIDLHTNVFLTNISKQTWVTISDNFIIF